MGEGTLEFSAGAEWPARRHLALADDRSESLAAGGGGSGPLPAGTPDLARCHARLAACIERLGGVDAPGLCRLAAAAATRGQVVLARRLLAGNGPGAATPEPLARLGPSAPAAKGKSMRLWTREVAGW